MCVGWTIAGLVTSEPPLSLIFSFFPQLPSARDLNTAFELADEDRSGRVNEFEFIRLFQVHNLESCQCMHRPGKGWGLG